MADSPESENPSPAPEASAPADAQMPLPSDVTFDLPPETAPDAGAMSSADQAAIDELLKQAQFDDVATASAEGNDPFAGMAAAMSEPAAPQAQTHAVELPNFQQVMADAQVSNIDLLRDVELNVKIELGRSRMLVEDVLKLGEGSVVELDKLAGDPVDVFVNDRLVARGEVLVLKDNFCVRVNEIVASLKEEAI